MFVRFPQDRQCWFFAAADLCTGQSIASWLTERLGLAPTNDLRLRLEQQGRPLVDWEAPLTAQDGPVTVLVGGGLPGGKGGFGSMLR